MLLHRCSTAVHLPTLPPDGGAQVIEERLLERHDALQSSPLARRFNKAQSAALVATSQRLLREQLPAVQLVAQVRGQLLSSPLALAPWPVIIALVGRSVRVPKQTQHHPRRRCACW